MIIVGIKKKKRRPRDECGFDRRRFSVKKSHIVLSPGPPGVPLNGGRDARDEREWKWIKKKAKNTDITPTIVIITVIITAEKQSPFRIDFIVLRSRILIYAGE